MLRPTHHNTVTHREEWLKPTGETRWVGATFPDIDPYYSTIQGAIDASSAGDTVWVHNGTYEEDLILADNVYVFCEPGTVIQPPSSGRADRHIDVDGVNGYIFGYAEFSWPASSTSGQYQIAIRNSGTLTLECEKVDQTGAGTPDHPGIYVEGGSNLNVDIRGYVRKLEAYDTDYGASNINGYINELNLFTYTDTDVRGKLELDYIGQLVIGYGDSDPQFFRYQIRAKRMQTGSLITTIAGKAMLDLRIDRWVHTPSVAGQCNFTIADEANVLFSGVCRSWTAAGVNTGPFFQLLNNLVTLILENCVMETAHTDWISATMPTSTYIAYGSYANQPAGTNVSAFGGLSVNQNVNVKA